VRFLRRSRVAALNTLGMIALLLVAFIRSLTCNTPRRLAAFIGPREFRCGAGSVAGMRSADARSGLPARDVIHLLTSPGT
jgi:hypothetical protein